MKRGLKNFIKGEGGFTLVEMVVVIAIMGVMAAVAVPMVNNTLGRSKERAYEADKAIIQTTVEAYYTAPDNARQASKKLINSASIFPAFDCLAREFKPLIPTVVRR